MQKWTPNMALNYMISHSDKFYLNKLQHRFDLFDVKQRCQKQFKAFNKIDVVCDIGAGVMGGALALFPYGETRSIVDLLSPNYQRIGKLPEDIYAYNADFAETGFETDSQDIVFCWEVLDHAQSDKHFIDGQKELIRILKPGGLLFFYHPLRRKEKPGHIIIRNEKQIMIEFAELELKWTKIEPYWERYEQGLYAVFTKKAEIIEKEPEEDS